MTPYKHALLAECGQCLSNAVNRHTERQTDRQTNRDTGENITYLAEVIKRLGLMITLMHINQHHLDWGTGTSDQRADERHGNPLPR